jgi:ankyrin repeat protein
LQDFGGWRPLHVAAYKGHLDVVQFLVEEANAGTAPITASDRSPLHLACIGGHLDVVRYLCESVALEVTARDNMGRTPLHFAALWGRGDVIKYLIRYGEGRWGPDGATGLKDKSGSTPADLAKAKNQNGVLPLLE